MSATETAPEPECEPQPPRSDLEWLDQVHGHLCGDCRLVWVGGYDARELGLDPETSPSLSESARAFAESARHICCADDEDAGNGYFDCLICNVTSIGGHKVVAYMVP